MARKKWHAELFKVSTVSGWLDEDEFGDELARRVEEIISGKVKTIPLDVAMREIHEELRRRRGGR